MQSSPTIRPALRVTFLVIGLASAAFGQQGFPVPILAPDAANSSGVNAYADNFAGRDDLQFVLFQPPPELSTAPQPAPRRYATGGRQSGNRLASVPNMFGDAPTAPVISQFLGVGQFTEVSGTIPTPGLGGAGAKLAENDRPIPTDRVFFSYNHFENVFEVVTNNLGFITTRQHSIDRYTFGFEKTFGDGWNSVALRVPIYSDFGYRLTDFGLEGGQFGNLAVVLKHLLYYGDAVAIGAGMAIDMPTGNDVVARLGSDRVRIRNEAVYLLPYIGFNYARGDPRWGWGDGLFVTGILQFSVATNGNTIEAEFGGPTTEELGKYNDQTLMLLDLGAGYWLYRDPYAARCTGLAVVGEMHYTTSLQGSDFAGGEFPGSSFTLGSEEGNRFDIVNFTIGIQALLFDASSFRVAGAFPLGSDRDERMFDSEVQFQFNRRF